MLRQLCLVTLTLAVAACAAQRTPRYVVRLDLDRIAAQSAADSGLPDQFKDTYTPLNPS